MLIAALASLLGCEEPTESAAEATEPVEVLERDPAFDPHSGTWSLTHLWWRSPEALLCAPWLGIIGGTVRQLRVHDDDWGPASNPDRRKGLNEATVEVERIFKGEDGTRFRFPENLKLLRLDGFEGVPVGSRVVVFLGAHEGGLAASGIREGDFAVGLRVSDWNDARLFPLTQPPPGNALNLARSTPEQRKMWYPTGALDCTR
jgi:hypothetical protein